MAKFLSGLMVVFLLSGCATPTVQAPGEATVTPALKDGYLIAHDGARLPMRSWMPKNETPAAVIIAVHGFNDYSNFINDAGDYLAGRSIATYAFDQRGFGASPAPGIWPGIDALTRDLQTVLALVRTRHPGVPAYLLGESMGGAVVMVTAKHARGAGQPLGVDGVILSAPAVWGRKTMPWYQRMALWVSSHTVPTLKLTGRGLKIMASDNIDMLLALGRDPLVIKETRIDAMYGLTNLMDAALNAASELDIPALILYGEKDEVIPRKPTEEMLARMPAAAKSQRTVIFYGQGYHMLMRDLQAKAVWKDIAGWVLFRQQSAKAPRHD